MDAALSSVVEPRAQPLDELLDGVVAVVELLGQLAEASEIGLAHELPLAEAVRDRLRQPELPCHPPHLVRHRAEAGAAQGLQ